MSDDHAQLVDDLAVVLGVVLAGVRERDGHGQLLLDAADVLAADGPPYSRSQTFAMLAMTLDYAAGLLVPMLVELTDSSREAVIETVVNYLRARLPTSSRCSRTAR